MGVDVRAPGKFAHSVNAGHLLTAGNMLPGPEVGGEPRGTGVQADHKSSDLRPDKRSKGARGNSVEFRGVSKSYGDVTAVRDVNLVIGRREFFTLLGPSGSGKTTLLRMIAGLIKPTGGHVLIEGEDMGTRPPYARGIGVVFQSLALFSHMNVFGNVAFPLRMRRVGRAEIRARVEAALDLVRLPHLGSRRVGELSGGQLQRVALARALVYEPHLLLLDEPLGALDRRLREEMQLELIRLHRELDVTVINVTHDQREALLMSTRIAVLNDGQIEQEGESEEIYCRPGTRFVAAFVGDATLVDGELIRSGTTVALHVGKAQIPVHLPVHAVAEPRREATLVLGSDALQVGSRADDLADCDVRLEAEVRGGLFEGTATQYELAVPALEMSVVRVSVPRALAKARFAPGDRVWLGWPSRAVQVLVSERPTSEPPT